MDPKQFEDHLVAQESFVEYEALQEDVATKYGRLVNGLPMTNRVYGRPHQALSQQNNLKPPPGSNRIFLGYVVVRGLCRQGQYETWMSGQTIMPSQISAARPTAGRRCGATRPTRL